MMVSNEQDKFISTAFPVTRIPYSQSQIDGTAVGAIDPCSCNKLFF